MFNELQHISTADLSETERIINTPAAPRVASSSSARGGGSEEVQALKHKMEVADAITKRLHRKNQELVAQLDKMKKEMPAGSHHGHSSDQSSSNNLLLVSPLKREIEAKDREIRALKDMLRSASASSSDQTATGTGGMGAAASFSSSSMGNHQLSSSVGIAKFGALFCDARARKLQEQYDELLGVKLECIAQGEATGKVNKEVKAFFTALKQKMTNDALFAEVERAANCELMFELEQRLASLS